MHRHAFFVNNEFQIFQIVFPGNSMCAEIHQIILEMSLKMVDFIISSKVIPQKITKTNYILLFLSNHSHKINIKITREKEKTNDSMHVVRILMFILRLLIFNLIYNYKFWLQLVFWLLMGGFDVIVEYLLMSVKSCTIVELFLIFHNININIYFQNLYRSPMKYVFMSLSLDIRWLSTVRDFSDFRHPLLFA